MSDLLEMFGELIGEVILGPPVRSAPILSTGPPPSSRPALKSTALFRNHPLPANTKTNPYSQLPNQNNRAIAMANGKGFWRAFLDWLTLFSGISTASNLSRTRKAPVVGRGLFLFRKPERPEAKR
jgi:hypothetical protein